MKYVKKPIPVEAHEWHRYGDAADVDHYRHPKGNGHRYCPVCGAQMKFHGWIKTLEGGHRVCPGDWIITGVQGEKYPCKPSIFSQTYEPYAGDTAGL